MVARQRMEQGLTVEDGRCRCAEVLGYHAGIELDRFQDLLAAGFDQWTASLLMWHWDRAEITKQLRPQPPRRRRRR